MGYRDATHSSHFFTDLVRETRAGKLVLPTFQRGFVWEESDVIALLDSLYRGYPIGTLLLWENWTASDRRTKAFTGCAPASPTATLVLDGQQRIQAMIHATEKNSGYAFDLAGDKFVRVNPATASTNFIPCHLFVDWLNFMDHFKAEYEVAHKDDPKPRIVGYAKRGKKGTTFPVYETDPAPPPTAEQIALSARITACENVLCTFKDARVGSVIIPADKDLAFCREVFRRMNLTGKAFTADEVFSCLENG